MSEQDAAEWTRSEDGRIIMRGISVVGACPTIIDAKAVADAHNASIKKAVSEYRDTNRMLLRKLTEAVEAQKPLVDALREIANSTNSHIANAALAKVKKP